VKGAAPSRDVAKRQECAGDDDSVVDGVKSNEAITDGSKMPNEEREQVL
jgi:hypothetical protein